jgi:hypothetical protein
MCPASAGSPVRVSDGNPTDVRLDGDEMAADADDGDAVQATAAYMALPGGVTGKTSR